MSAAWRLVPVTSVRVISPSKQSRSTASQVAIASADGRQLLPVVALGCACTATVRLVWSHQ